MTFEVELTDTFGGDANYSWVRRAKFEAPANASNALLMRRAKRIVGLTNHRGRVDDYGDTLDFRPYRMCMVMFIIPVTDL